MVKYAVKKEVVKEGRWRNFEEIVADKFNMFCLVCFILSLFLLDINANKVADNGIDYNVHFFGNITFAATSAFWVGFIAAMAFFFLVAIRSFYLKGKYHSRIDLFVAIIGVIGMMIILSGGLLHFWDLTSNILPFFAFNLSVITYYHIGIAIEIISMLYFALTK